MKMGGKGEMVGCEGRVKAKVRVVFIFSERELLGRLR